MEKTNTRYRKIKKYGNSYVIFLKSIDMIDLNIKENDEADISDIVIKRGGKKK